jgi:hypothetical protein
MAIRLEKASLYLDMSTGSSALREHMHRNRVQVTERGRGKRRLNTNGRLHIGGVVLGTEVDMKVDVVVLVRPRGIVCCAHCALCTLVVVRLKLKLGMVSTKCRRFGYLIFFVATYYIIGKRERKNNKKKKEKKLFIL